MSHHASTDPVSFDAQIKALFRDQDQRAMRFAFDLWSYEDVSRYADAILARLRSGSMPCDDPWPDDRVDLFEQWIHGGKTP